VAVLAAIAVAIDDLRGSRARNEAQALARIALERCGRRWDAARAPIPFASLEAWLDLAGRLQPAPALPSLAVTWAELLPARSPSPDDRAEVERFSDWLMLCRLLWHEHSEIRTRLDLGPQQLGFMLDFLDNLARRPELPRDDQVLRALEAIAELIPQLRGRAERMARRARGYEEGGWRAWPAASEISAEADGERFDVRRVLADL
jgi:hypothetical protein